MAALAGLNAQVLGISVDHIPCLKSWADSLGGISYPLLSDFWPHGFVSQMYDVFRTRDGYTERAIFVIDKHGSIRYIDVHAIDDRPDNEEVYKVLRQIESERTELGLASALSAASTGVYLDDQEQEAIPQADVLLYCARWCKDCRKAKAWLDEHEVMYAEVDIDTNIVARNQVRKWGNGYLVTPVIKIGDTIVLDFDEPKLEEAVRKFRAG